jgi:predicted transcriptional regulator
MWLDFAFVFLGLLLSLPLLSLARAQRKRTLAAAVARALEIAKIHGWVSAGRLMVQVNITERDAKEALAEASREGLLFQAEDGRYYPKQETSTLPMRQVQSTRPAVPSAPPNKSLPPA